MKPLILYHPEEHSNLTASFLQPLWNKFFDCEPWDHQCFYDPKKTVLWIKHLDPLPWYQEYQDRGFKVVVDHLWDNPVTVGPLCQDNQLTLQCGNWIWYNESLWYQNLKYDQFERRYDRKYFFLMLMRKKLDHRDRLLDKMQPFLDESLYSYVFQNKMLATDLDPADDLFQRYYDPLWYNQSEFSMVAESCIDDNHYISEKSFKPMAFQQGFLIWGSPNTLKYLHSLGFETFPHYIDESYDYIIDDSVRLRLISDQVDYLYKKWRQGDTLFGDSISQEKIKHNRNLFYHPDIADRFVREIIHPIMEFVDA